MDSNRLRWLELLYTFIVVGVVVVVVVVFVAVVTLGCCSFHFRIFFSHINIAL